MPSYTCVYIPESPRKKGNTASASKDSDNDNESDSTSEDESVAEPDADAEVGSGDEERQLCPIEREVIRRAVHQTVTVIISESTLAQAPIRRSARLNEGKSRE